LNQVDLLPLRVTGDIRVGDVRQLAGARLIRGALIRGRQESRPEILRAAEADRIYRDEAGRSWFSVPSP